MASARFVSVLLANQVVFVNIWLPSVSSWDFKLIDIVPRKLYISPLAVVIIFLPIPTSIIILKIQRDARFGHLRPNFTFPPTNQI